MENARGLDRHLAQWLLARGEIVRDGPSTATAPVRELPRGRHKNDVIDAAAAAGVAALQGDASPVAADDLATVPGLLDERHSAPAAPAETAREQLARDLVTEIRGTDRRLKMLTANIAATVAEHGSKLPEAEGIGPVIADRLLGRTHRASRFPHVVDSLVILCAGGNASTGRGHRW